MDLLMYPEHFIFIPIPKLSYFWIGVLGQGFRENKSHCVRGTDHKCRSQRKKVLDKEIKENVGQRGP